MTAGGVDPADVQANVLHGYDLPRASYLLFCAEADADVPGFVGRLLPEVTTEADERAARGTGAPSPSRVTMNVALTHAGLRRCGLSSDDLASFPEAFSQGMAARSATALGDAGVNEVASWESYGLPVADVGGGAGEPGRGAGTVGGAASRKAVGPVDVLVFLHFRDEGAGNAAIGKIRRLGRASHLRCVHVEAAAVPGDGARNRRDAPDHFGFVDGLSQPAVDPGDPHLAGGGIPNAGGGWRPLPLGEFVLGHPDLESPEPPVPRPVELVRNGSYLVVRKIQQHVGPFRAFLAEAAETHAGLADADGRPIPLEARFVGRLPSGETLVPDALGPNDFRYRDDPQGYRCPLGSHVRRANPRDELGFDGALVQRHRMIRRGMPYGPAYDDQPEAERGLLFVAYVADIARQFEFVQRRWLNDADNLGLGHDADPIAGSGPSPQRFVVQGRPPRIIAGIPAFVQVRWGEYFFQPGIAGLRRLAERAR